jgi:hypothetical protein
MRIGEIKRVGEREIPLPARAPPARREPVPSSPQAPALPHEHEPRGTESTGEDCFNCRRR